MMGCFSVSVTRRDLISWCRLLICIRTGAVQKPMVPSPLIILILGGLTMALHSIDLPSHHSDSWWVVEGVL